MLMVAAWPLAGCVAGELSGSGDGAWPGDAACTTCDGATPGDAPAGDAPCTTCDAGPTDAPPSEQAPADGKPPLDAKTPLDTKPPVDAAPQVDGPSCVDNCPAPNGGVTWGCKKRFMYGTNWAWLNFGGDFGGVAAWNQVGVSGDSAQYSSGMSQMKAGGVNVIRWWMFPRFWTEAISFGSDDAPTGIGGTLVADIHKALELAEQHDLYIMLTPFSFDNFTPTTTEAGVYTRGIQPMVVDAARRQKLLQNLVVPVAKAVESSPFKKRMIAWDMINEPEWAISGANLYGSEPFTPQSGLQAVTHAQMETWLKEMANALHANSSALVTVGGAAIKWAKAWSQVNVDFYQLHYYDWVYEWYPYTTVTLASVGLTGKPVVMGEFPNQGLSAIASKGLPAVSASQLAADLWSHGYAGALSWAYNDSSFPWSSTTLQGFASQHPCETKY